jgi:hypothetical protein
MAFNPFASPSRDHFGQSRFTDSIGQQSSVIAGFAGDTAANKNFIRAARLSSEFQKKQMEYQARLARAGQPSTGSQIGSAVGSAAAGAAVSAGIALI